MIVIIFLKTSPYPKKLTNNISIEMSIKDFLTIILFTQKAKKSIVKSQNHNNPLFKRFSFKMIKKWSIQVLICNKLD